MPDHLDVALSGAGVLTLTLNRPTKRNAIDAPMVSWYGSRASAGPRSLEDFAAGLA